MAKKYIDAERLKAEIEKHIKEVKDAEKRFTPNMGFFDAKLSGIYDVMAIIDSLQQEQPELPDKSLDEEIRRYYREECSSDDEPTTEETARHFAEWQKEQMTKDAVEGEVVQDIKGRFHIKTNVVSDILYQFGDKVKVIILKQ